MPAFQDFGPVTERRRAEKRQRRKKQLIVAGVSVFFLLILASVATIVIVRYERLRSSSKSGNSSSSSPSSSSGTAVKSVSKSIQTVCSNTDYRKVCESSLTKAVKNTSSSTEPKDILRAAISVIGVEISNALNGAKLVKSDDPMVSGAVEDCKELFGHAMKELNDTLQTVDGNDLVEMPKKTHELKNWLSAVISYQQTCVDGFPEGETKAKMENAVKKAKQLTSNALAIIDEAVNLLSSFDTKGLGFGRRRLMDSARNTGGRFPNWINPEEERRILKERTEKKLKPNVVVSKDGSGKFKTITEALAAMPAKYDGRYVIYVKAGIYNESPTVTSKMPNVTMYGDGSRKTIVTGNKNFVDGTRTFQTATFVAVGEGFMAISMGFRNTAGAIKHQAVALRVQSDRSIFLNCRMEGYQDTLYAQTHRQFYRSCVITGTVDFIFGDAAAVFQNCEITVLRPLDNQQNIVTAQGRIDRRETTGFVLQGCRITADKKLLPDAGTKIRSYLGRPWKEYSRNIVMESSIDGFIHPDGYLPWEGDFALKTLYYGEYNNKGEGASMNKRVKWPGVKTINKNLAQEFTVAAFIQGGQWLGTTGIPVRLGLYS